MDEFLQHTFNGLSIGSIYLLVGVGLTLVYGVARVTDFAQGQYLVAASFVAWAMAGEGIPYGVAVVLSTGIVATIACVVNALFLRDRVRDELAAFLLTLGIGIVIEQVLIELWSPSQRFVSTSLQTDVTLAGVSIGVPRLLIIGVSIPLLLGLHVLLSRTTLGRDMRATAENREVATLMGIDTNRVTTLAFFLGSGLAATAGAILASVFPFTPYTGDAFLLKGLAVALAGGLGSIPGAVLCGPLLGLFETYGAAYGITIAGYTFGSEWLNGWAFASMIAVLCWRPTGLFRTRT